MTMVFAGQILTSCQDPFTNVGDLSCSPQAQVSQRSTCTPPSFPPVPHAERRDVPWHNDRMGNPIEIAEVVAGVSDTVKTSTTTPATLLRQAETALRHVASIYSYDHMEDESESDTAITLRSNIEEGFRGASV